MSHCTQQANVEQEERCKSPENLIELQDISSGDERNTRNVIQFKLEEACAKYEGETPEEANAKSERETQRNFIGETADSGKSENTSHEPPSSKIKGGGFFPEYPCKFCGKLFSDWDLIKIHVNILKEAHTLE